MVAIQDPEADVRAALEEYGAALPVLLDSGGQLGNAYGVSAIPTTVVVDAEGRIITTKVGGVTAAGLVGMVNGG